MVIKFKLFEGTYPIDDPKLIDNGPVKIRWYKNGKLIDDK